MSDPQVTDPRLRDLRTRLDAVWESYLAEIEKAVMPEDAWVAIDGLQKDLEKPWRTQVKKLRARVAKRLYDERLHSLAKLAEFTGVSRGRAGQFKDEAEEDAV